MNPTTSPPPPSTQPPALTPSDFSAIHTLTALSNPLFPLPIPHITPLIHYLLTALPTPPPTPSTPALHHRPPIIPITAHAFAMEVYETTLSRARARHCGARFDSTIGDERNDNSESGIFTIEDIHDALTILYLHTGDNMSFTDLLEAVAGFNEGEGGGESIPYTHAGLIGAMKLLYGVDFARLIAAGSYKDGEETETETEARFENDDADGEMQMDDEVVLVDSEATETEAEGEKGRLEGADADAAGGVGETGDQAVYVDDEATESEPEGGMSEPANCTVSAHDTNHLSAEVGAGSEDDLYYLGSRPRRMSRRETEGDKLRYSARYHPMDEVLRPGRVGRLREGK
ncbi:hypothetical protein ACLMJK_002857 [Lecanora helva]